MTYFIEWKNFCKRKNRSNVIIENKRKQLDRIKLHTYFRSWCRYVVKELLKHNKAKNNQIQELHVIIIY